MNVAFRCHGWDWGLNDLRSDNGGIGVDENGKRLDLFPTVKPPGKPPKEK